MRKELLEAISAIEDVNREIAYHQTMIKDLRKRIRVHQKFIETNKEILLTYKNIIKQRQTELSKLNGGNENG